MVFLRFSIESQSCLLRFWFRWVAAACFLTFKVEHAGDYDPKSPCLIVTNHQSLFDIPAALFAFSGNVRMVAKRELFLIPLFGQAMSLGGFIPVSRGNKDSSAKVLLMIKRAFEKSIQVWVAPEGTRSVSGKLGAYKWGSFGLAITAQVPIQPIVVLDSGKVLPKNSLLPRVGATIHSVVLPQLSTLGLTSNDRKALANRVHELTQTVIDRRTL